MLSSKVNIIIMIIIKTQLFWRKTLLIIIIFLSKTEIIYKHFSCCFYDKLNRISNYNF